MWLESLGLDAEIPPPEEEDDVKSALDEAKTAKKRKSEIEKSSKRASWNFGRPRIPAAADSLHPVPIQNTNIPTAATSISAHVAASKSRVVGEIGSPCMIFRSVATA